MIGTWALKLLESNADDEAQKGANLHRTSPDRPEKYVLNRFPSKETAHWLARFLLVNICSKKHAGFPPYLFRHIHCEYF